MNRADLIKLLNEDLSLAFRSHVQTISNLSSDNGASLDPARSQRLRHLDEHLRHTKLLARQIDRLGGLPTTEVSPVHWSTDIHTAMAEEMALESIQLMRLRRRTEQARELGADDVARALESIAEDAEQQIDTLSVALALETTDN